MKNLSGSSKLGHVVFWRMDLIGRFAFIENEVLPMCYVSYRPFTWMGRTLGTFTWPFFISSAAWWKGYNTCCHTCWENNDTSKCAAFCEPLLWGNLNFSSVGNKTHTHTHTNSTKELQTRMTDFTVQCKCAIGIEHLSLEGDKMHQKVSTKKLQPYLGTRMTF